MTAQSTNLLWAQCVDPDFGPSEPLEGFEVLVAAEEPIGTNNIMYRTVRCRWERGEWQDQEDRVIRLCQSHSIEEPQEELDSAWDDFCESVRQLNALNAAEARLINQPCDRSPRGRLSGLARCLLPA